MVREIRVCGGLLPHADPDAREPVVAQMLDDVLQSVVPAGTPLFPDPDRPRRKIDVVADDEQVVSVAKVRETSKDETESMEESQSGESDHSGNSEEQPDQIL